MSQEFERFGAYLKVADMMIEQASKEGMAETARVLALLLRTTKRSTTPSVQGIPKAHAHGDN